MSANDIANRHMRPAAGLADPGLARSLTVRLRIAPAWATTAAGQLMLSCLLNLLCRQTDLVATIDLNGADVPVLVPLPHGKAAGSLLPSLRGLATWAVGTKVAVTLNDVSAPADVTLDIGRSETAHDDAATLVGFADGWRAWVGTPDRMPSEEILPQSANSLGPFLAATVLAGEVFKRARGVTRGRLIEAFGYSLWSGRQDTEWSALDEGPTLLGSSLPPFYLVGAGAVGQALAYVLGSADLVSGYIVIIDDDAHDGTNLNRCFLAGVDDVGKGKIDAVKRFLKRRSIDTYARRAALTDYVGRPHPDLRPDLAERERHGLFDVAVSCVDKGTSRQDLQGLWPGLIIGGSTNGLTAKAMVCDLTGGTACLGCHNPPEQDGARLRELEQQVRTMGVGERRAYLSGKVDDIEAVMAYLESPKCGMAGEQHFRKFATEQAREFSVSFVSMAAGVLATARLLTRLLFNEADAARPMMTSIAFLNGNVEDDVIAIDQDCCRCSTAARQRFREIWEESHRIVGRGTA